MLCFRKTGRGDKAVSYASYPLRLDEMMSRMLLHFDFLREKVFFPLEFSRTQMLAAWPSRYLALGLAHNRHHSASCPVRAKAQGALASEVNSDGIGKGHEV